MFGRFGIWEIALVLVIILIIFGVGKLPQVGGAIGKGLRAFKKGQSGEELAAAEEKEEEKEKEKKGKKVANAKPKKTTRKKVAKG
ncbi:twin-arginine translocase TatA/TatE family subunit [Chloroflexota bacterium]